MHLHKNVCNDFYTIVHAFMPSLQDIKENEKEQSSLKEHLNFKIYFFLSYTSTENKSCVLERNKNETEIC